MFIIRDTMMSVHKYLLRFVRNWFVKLCFACNKPSWKIFIYLCTLNRRNKIRKKKCTSRGIHHFT